MNSPRFVKWFDPVAGSATNDAADEQIRRILIPRFAFTTFGLWRGDNYRNQNRCATLIRHALPLTLTQRLLTIAVILSSFGAFLMPAVGLPVLLPPRLLAA